MISPLDLYVETNGDGGDCPNRCGIMLCYFGFTDNLPNQDLLVGSVLKNLMVSTNVYIRYPIEWNKTSDFSRDQASRLMLGFGVTKRSELVKGYYKLLVKNWFRHQNGDFIGTGEPGNIIRGLNLWWMYPLLLVFDLKFLFDLYFRSHTVTLSPFKVTSGIVWGYEGLYLPDLLYANKKYWTPWASLAKKMLNQVSVTKGIETYYLDPTTNGCIEAGNAMNSMLSMLKG